MKLFSVVKLVLFPTVALGIALYFADESWFGTMMLVYDEAVNPGTDVSHLRQELFMLRANQTLQGLGFGIAVQLLSLGCRTMLGQRSFTNTTESDLMAEAIKLNPTTAGSLVRFPVDLSSPKSVREASSTFSGPLDILILNAVILPVTKELTEEGVEVALATSYYGHILLVHQLQSHLIGTSRVIMVNSENHKIPKILRPNSVANSPEITAGTSLAYYSWLKLLGAAWTQTRMNCADPGPVQTGIHRQAPAAFAWVFETMIRPFMRDAIEAAEPFGYLAAGEVHRAFSETKSVHHGEYWVMWTKPHRSPLLSNETLLAELWSETSQVLRRLDPVLNVHKAC